MKTKTTTLFGAILLAAMLVGCSQHDELPTELRFIPAPTPTVTAVVDNGDGTYLLQWDVDDDIAVAEYRIYSLSEFAPPNLEGTTTDKEFGVNLLIPIGGIAFGITAVTVENVEGAMAIAVTPDP